MSGTISKNIVIVDFFFQDSNKYDDWRHYHYPHLAEVLALFPSCKPQASLLAALLPPLQARFYSISSSPLAHENRVHVTVAVVTYSTQSKYSLAVIIRIIIVHSNLVLWQQKLVA